MSQLRRGSFPSLRQPTDGATWFISSQAYLFWKYLKETFINDVLFIDLMIHSPLKLLPKYLPHLSSSLSPPSPPLASCPLGSFLSHHPPPPLMAWFSLILPDASVLSFITTMKLFSPVCWSSLQSLDQSLLWWQMMPAKAGFRRALVHLQWLSLSPWCFSSQLQGLKWDRPTSSYSTETCR